MSNSRNKVVGLLVGRENTFPQPFIDMVNERGKSEGVTAELAVLGGTPELAEPHHAVWSTASRTRSPTTERI
jgi:hypothetical protein